MINNIIYTLHGVFGVLDNYTKYFIAKIVQSCYM